MLAPPGRCPGPLEHARQLLSMFPHPPACVNAHALLTGRSCLPRRCAPGCRRHRSRRVEVVAEERCQDRVPDRHAEGYIWDSQATEKLAEAEMTWPTSGHLGRSSFSGDSRRPPAPGGDFKLILVRDLRGMKRSRRSLCQTQILICRDFYGSDGTRTRDLRRDRPVLALRG